MPRLLGVPNGRLIVLVTGSSGYVGQHLVKALSKDPEIKLHAAYGSLQTFETDVGDLATCHSVDMTNEDTVRSLLATVTPDVVVHLAAVSSPAVCERAADRSFAINCPLHLLTALSPDCAVIFLSTDQVYDGLSPPYTETSPTKPVNVYGRSKLQFEEGLLASRPRRTVCLRSSLIVGEVTPFRCRKQTFLQFCREKLEAGTPADFFTDEIRSVVGVTDVIAHIRFFIKGGAVAKPGVYNMGGPAALSRHQIAMATAKSRHLDASCARPILRSAMPPGPVASPPDISMDSDVLHRLTSVTATPLDEILRDEILNQMAARDGSSSVLAAISSRILESQR